MPRYTGQGSITVKVTFNASLDVAAEDYDDAYGEAGGDLDYIAGEIGMYVDKMISEVEVNETTISSIDYESGPPDIKQLDDSGYTDDIYDRWKEGDL
jgi:hypothetical protein